MGLTLGLGLGLGRSCGASGPPPVMVDAIQFAGSQSFSSGYYGGTTLGTARVRFRLDEIAASGFKIIAGTDAGGGGDGWLISTDDDVGAGGASQVVVYAKVAGGAWTRLFRKFFVPSDVGRIFTFHIVCDGGEAFVYLDGKRTKARIAATSIVASTGKVNIGGNAAGAYSSAVTVLDVAEGTVPLTPSEVATDCASATPAFAGQTHRWVAAASITTTWADQVGAADLTAHGAPTAASIVQTLGNHLGAIEIYGDSIAAGRQADTGLGNGWRRAVQMAAGTAGNCITEIGYIPFSASTKDFDYWGTAVGGTSLSADRLPTLQADLAANGAPDAATYLAYGVNDIAAINRTAVQLAADVTTAVGLIDAARPGRPIFIQSILPVSTAGATAPQHAEINSYNSGFASMIATLQATYPAVVGVDVTAAISNADDTAQLYDGIHPTPAGYAAMAAIIAPIVLAAMGVTMTSPSFNPASASPASFYRQPNYVDGGATGTWTKTAGSNLTATTDHATASAAPGAAAPVFGASSKPLVNSVAVSTWMGTGDCYVLAVLDVATITTTGTLYGGGCILADSGAWSGLLLRRAGAGPYTYFAEFFGGAGGTDTASVEVTAMLSASGAGRLVLQAKKSGGHIWIRANSGAWVDGGAAGTTGGGGGGTMVVGTNYSGAQHFQGTIRALGTWAAAKDAAFSDDVVIWAEQEF